MSRHYCMKCDAEITLASIGGKCLSCWADEKIDRAETAYHLEKVAKTVQEKIKQNEDAQMEGSL